MSDVFISHSSKDKAAADKVVSFLEEKGLSCWIAPRDIVPGSDWAASISTAITTSKVFLVLYSANSSGSNQVAREISLAESKSNIFVVPYKIDDTELSGSFEYYLTGAHWITADYKKKDYKLEELYNIIAGITGKNVQNITNNTYIDHLHIHGDGNLPNDIQQGVKSAQNAASQFNTQTVRPAPAAQTAPEKKESGKKRMIIAIVACIAAAAILVTLILVAISAAILKSKKDSGGSNTTTSSQISSEVSYNDESEAAGKKDDESSSSSSSESSSKDSSKSSYNYGDFEPVLLLNRSEDDIIKIYGKNYTYGEHKTEYQDHYLVYDISGQTIFGVDCFSALTIAIDSNDKVCAVSFGAHDDQFSSDAELENAADKVYAAVKAEFGSPDTDYKDDRSIDYIYKMWKNYKNSNYPDLGEIFFYSSNHSWMADDSRTSRSLTVSFETKTQN